MIKAIECCRICGNANLVPVLDLGEQVLTGVFPVTAAEPVTAGPLRLVKCHGADSCGLLQLQHSFDLDEMYGENYGYRSGLNSSMVRHLKGKVQRILRDFPTEPGALIIDIGSNDSTTLQAYPAEGLTLVGVDPTGKKFLDFYPEHIQLIPEFFSAEAVQAAFPGRTAAVITSFSMFYDLEDPMQFMREVHALLSDNGIWVFEQSYMPTMMAMNSFDTVCHEHIEYYALHQIVWMAERVGLSLLDVEFNDVNGGSFSVIARKNAHVEHGPGVLDVLNQERQAGLDDLLPYEEFADRTVESRRRLTEFVRDTRRQGKTVCALGASTKGNVLLQYCGFTSADIGAIGEINEDKFGKLTPGTSIPIRPEAELIAGDWDYFLILPWHYESSFTGSAQLKGRNLVFPLPELRIVVP